MRVLRFAWSGVLAFDRIGGRFPYLVQIWLVELFLVMATAFFVGKVVDVRGCCGVPGTHDRIDGEFWGCLVVALLLGFFFVRGLVRPRTFEGSWGPHRYTLPTSHPSFALLLLLTLPLPLVMVLATRHQGDSVFYTRATGWAGIATIGVLALARLVVWFARRPPGTDRPRARESWAAVWQPVVALVALVYAIVGIPLGWMAWQEHRTIERLPVATAEALQHPGQYYRVEGELVGDPVFWAPKGTGRGGNNYAGAGVLVALDGGGEVLLLAESLSVPDLRADLEGVEDGRFRSVGRTIIDLTEDETTYYGFDLGDFPPPDPAGRVLLLRSYP